jgi:hypothetical protein
MRTVFALVLGIVIVLAVMGLGVTTISTAPDHALVYADIQSREYFAPPCVDHASELIVLTIGQVHDLDYRPNSDCVNAGAFQSNTRSLITVLLESVGVLSPPPSRWNSDGTWNW